MEYLTYNLIVLCKISDQVNQTWYFWVAYDKLKGFLVNFGQLGSRNLPICQGNTQKAENRFLGMDDTQMTQPIGIYPLVNVQKTMEHHHF